MRSLKDTSVDPSRPQIPKRKRSLWLRRLLSISSKSSFNAEPRFERTPSTAIYEDTRNTCRSRHPATIPDEFVHQRAVFVQESEEHDNHQRPAEVTAPNSTMVTFATSSPPRRRPVPFDRWTIEPSSPADDSSDWYEWPHGSEPEAILDRPIEGSMRLPPLSPVSVPEDRPKHLVPPVRPRPFPPPPAVGAILVGNQPGNRPSSPKSEHTRGVLLPAINSLGQNSPEVNATRDQRSGIQFG